MVAPIGRHNVVARPIGASPRLPGVGGLERPGCAGGQTRIDCSGGALGTCPARFARTPVAIANAGDRKPLLARSGNRGVLDSQGEGTRAVLAQGSWKVHTGEPWVRLISKGGDAFAIANIGHVMNLLNSLHTVDFGWLMRAGSGSLSKVS
jgi:hypothetical protein